MDNLYEAYREWNATQAKLARCKRAFRRIEKELDLIEDGLHTAIAEELATTRAGKKVLHAFTGHTPYGWEQACGTDGRFRKLARRIGWEKFYPIIKLARKMEEW